MLRFLIALAMGLLLAGACGGEDDNRLPPPGDGDGDADSDGDGDTDADGDGDAQCFQDDDEDGYGPLCPAGEDCNDNDPEVHDDCSTCREGVPYPDCPCFGTEDPQECHSSDLYEDPNSGRLECRVGTISCVENAEVSPETGFAWTPCLDDNGVDVNE